MKKSLSMNLSIGHSFFHIDRWLNPYRRTWLLAMPPNLRILWSIRIHRGSSVSSDNIVLRISNDYHADNWKNIYRGICLGHSFYRTDRWLNPYRRIWLLGMAPDLMFSAEYMNTLRFFSVFWQYCVTYIWCLPCRYMNKSSSMNRSLDHSFFHIDRWLNPYRQTWLLT